MPTLDSICPAIIKDEKMKQYCLKSPNLWWVFSYPKSVNVKEKSLLYRKDWKCMLDAMCYYSDELHCLKVKAQVSGVQPTALFLLAVQGTLASSASDFPTYKNVNK